MILDLNSLLNDMNTPWLSFLLLFSNYINIYSFIFKHAESFLRHVFDKLDRSRSYPPDFELLGPRTCVLLNIACQQLAGKWVIEIIRHTVCFCFKRTDSKWHSCCISFCLFVCFVLTLTSRIRAFHVYHGEENRHLSNTCHILGPMSGLLCS